MTKQKQLKIALIKFFLCSLVFLAYGFACQAFAAPNPEDLPRVLFSWDLPTEREDGSALTPQEIQGFKLYLSLAGDLVETANIEGPATSYEREIVSPGAYTAQISTVDSDGVEGNKSAPIAFYVSEKPKAPVTPPAIPGIEWSCSVNCAYELKQ